MRKFIMVSLLISTNIIVFSQKGVASQLAINNCDEYQLLKNIIFRNNDLENRIIIPTAFTPNGDGLNDFFKLPKEITACVSNFEIFNRSGQLIYKANQVLFWDGRTFSEGEAPSGTYHYTFNLDNQLYKGYLVLLR